MAFKKSSLSTLSLDSSIFSFAEKSMILVLLVIAYDAADFIRDYISAPV